MFPIKQVLKPICPAKEVSWTELLPRLYVRYSWRKETNRGIWRNQGTRDI